jgi:peptide/nickel transport system substrate-binding protein
MAAYGLPKAMYHAQCLSFHMCGAPGITDAGSDVDRSAGIAHAQTLVREAGYNNEKTVFVIPSCPHCWIRPAWSLRPDAPGGCECRFPHLWLCDGRRTPQQPGACRERPVERRVIRLEQYRHDESASDPTISNNCTDSYPGWYCDPKLTLLLMQYPETGDPANRKQLEAQIQADFRSNVNLVSAGQFSKPIAYWLDLKGG